MAFNGGVGLFVCIAHEEHPQSEVEPNPNPNPKPDPNPQSEVESLTNPNRIL